MGNSLVPTTPNKVSTKYLGVYINPDLVWKDHLQYVLSKMRKGKGAIYRAKRTVNLQGKKLLYNAFFTSHLQYAMEVWYPDLNKTQKVKVERLQKATVRTMALERKEAHSSPLLKKLELLKVEDLMKINILRTLILAKRQHLPPNIQDKFEFIETSTRSGTSLFYKNKSKEKLHYLKAYKEYSGLVASTFTLETILTNLKGMVVSNYTSRCQRNNCYSCKTH